MNSLKYLIAFNASRNFVKRSCGGNFGFYQLKRLLYSPANLKLDSVDLNGRAHDFLSSDFLEKMKKVTATEDNKEVIFSSDLLKMMRLVKNEEDMTLFLKLLRKYARQNITIQFSSYHFGPPVMRLLHILKKPKEALALMKEKELSKIFSPVSCKIILFDLLYEQQMYDEIIRLFNEDRDKYRANALLLVYFAACWKANTPESYKKALETQAYLQEINQNLPLMAKNFLALLSLEQNNPVVAYEIVSNVPLSVPINIKARALAKAGRFKDLFDFFESLIHNSSFGKKKSTITSDTVNFISKELENANVQGEENTKWNQIIQDLEKNQLFDIRTLEDHIRELMFRKVIYRKEDNDQNFKSL